MIQIQPINLGLPAQEATHILIRPIINSTQDTSCNTYYQVFSKEGQELASGNLPIDEKQYAEWADDNSFIENIVLSTLKLNRL